MKFMSNLLMNILKNLKTIKIKIMKTINSKTLKALFLMSSTFLFLLFSCDSQTKTNGQKVVLGIHVVANVSEIPAAIIDTLKSKGVQIESNQQQPVLGYISKADSMVLQIDLSEQNIKLVKTIYLADKEQKYYGLVGITPSTVINVASIKKTKANGTNVEIYFNSKGAKDWADFTKQNIGKSIAFIIDNQIYAIPVINGEIKHGIAMITGLNNETFAKNISESLNLSIPK
jgi:preprotein translocase subunit SecD